MQRETRTAAPGMLQSPRPWPITLVETRDQTLLGLFWVNNPPLHAELGEKTWVCEFARKAVYCMYECSKVIYHIKTLDSSDMPFEVVIHRRSAKGVRYRAESLEDNMSVTAEKECLPKPDLMLIH